MTAEFRHSGWAVRGYRLYSLLASALMVLVGLCSSLEWWLDLNLVPDLGGRDMRLTAALCILLSGLALMVLHAALFMTGSQGDPRPNVSGRCHEA